MLQTNISTLTAETKTDSHINRQQPLVDVNHLMHRFTLRLRFTDKCTNKQTTDKLTSVVKIEAMYGAIKPDEAAMPLEMPIRVPAYCGAMSMWLTKYPENTQPLTDTAIVSRVTANAVCVQSRKLSPINSALAPNDPVHKTTHIIDSILLSREQYILLNRHTANNINLCTNTIQVPS